jgi:rubrerythrin
MSTHASVQGFEEAVVKALEYENRIRDIYREACTASRDPVGRTVFAVLADEEQGHVDYLEHALCALRTTSEATPGELTTTLPSREVIEAGIARLEGELAPAPDRESEEALLRKALAAEVETSRFYHQMVAELPPAGRAFFTPFLAIEDGHIAIVQAELDSVTGLGFWFDHREFDLETR